LPFSSNSDAIAGRDPRKLRMAVLHQTARHSRRGQPGQGPCGNRTGLETGSSPHTSHPSGWPLGSERM
jgi:hypothetical protein